MSEHEFAIYRQDEFLASGTARELGRKFNVSPKYIKYLSTPAHQRRIKSTKKPTKAKFAIKLGALDE